MDRAWEVFAMVCAGAMLIFLMGSGYRECRFTEERHRWCNEHAGVFKDGECVRPVLPEPR